MRISTAHSFDAGIDQLQRRQSALVEVQEQLTSGKRVSKASDDPTAAARAERAMVSIARSEADQRAIDASRNALTLGEAALGDANELLQRARELMVASGNATYGDRERAGLAQQLSGIRAQLLTIANRDDGAGSYLFAGQGSSGAPFVDDVGGVRFAGVPGELGNAAREPLPLSVDGEAAWLGGAAGGVFATLDRAITDLQTPGRSNAQIAATTAQGLADIDGALGALQSLRSRVGEFLERADMIEGRVADGKLAAQTERSAAEDLDMVQAIAEFQSQQTGYDAALKTYASVQRMSLFQYLNGG
jgi:flagellar hook-associated protein 3 FlgL